MSRTPTLNADLQRQAQALVEPLLPLILARYTASGTWTPTLISTGSPAGSFTYAVREGYWRREGTLLFISCRVAISATDVAPGAGNLRIVGLPAYLPVSNDASDVRVSPINNVALTASRYGLTARVISEAGQARIELREFGSGVGAAQYTAALLAASTGWDIGVAGRYLIDDAAGVVAAGDALDLSTTPGTSAGVSIHVI